MSVELAVRVAKAAALEVGMEVDYWVAPSVFNDVSHGEDIMWWSPAGSYEAYKAGALGCVAGGFDLVGWKCWTHLDIAPCAELTAAEVARGVMSCG